MAILLLAEHDNATVSDLTARALTAASQIGGDIDILVAGKGAQGAADAAAKLAGVRKVLLADSETLENHRAEPLADLRTSLPVQVGGAVGTLAATTELAGSVDGALALSDALADELILAPAAPWHTTRSPVTRIGDALVTCCDAWGHVAADVATGSRPELGELAEGSGGGSSTMPHKNNPVRSVLIRRAIDNVSETLVAVCSPLSSSCCCSFGTCRAR